MFTNQVPFDRLQTAKSAAPVPAPPVSATTELPELAELFTTSDAACLPALLGEKATVIAQLCPAATLVPHVLLASENPAALPATAMELMDSAAVPVFVSVMLRAAEVFTR